MGQRGGPAHRLGPQVEHQGSRKTIGMPTGYLRTSQATPNGMKGQFGEKGTGVTLLGVEVLDHRVQVVPATAAPDQDAPKPLRRQRLQHRFQDRRVQRRRQINVASAEGPMFRSRTKGQWWEHERPIP